ncbi:MAG TPA: L-seryl-tRNA(Sec) selenium transferase [Pseudomonadales bacterium]|nr:L-seryl-tRNA(Sec) selenium transferase [Pseudomonadales bacterium]
MNRSAMPPAFADLPAIDRLLAHADAAPLLSRWGRALTLGALRASLDAARAGIAAGAAPAIDAASLVAAAHAALARTPSGPRQVLNLSGTVIHTNLGRAPLPEAAIRAMTAAAGATDVEFDLVSGRRGERDEHVEALLAALTGAEAATVVNNNAAAVLLVLNTFASGREVPVSRGELVEIGGAFRIPEIMTRAGARLREVGTTNRTHARDFAEAIGAETGLVMKIHPSNYVVEGFSSEVPIEDLAALTRPAGIPLAWDLGSGSLVDLTRWGLPREPMPQDGLRGGADLVTFSGDKLLGGPQAGIIVGSRETIDALRANPLKRALRVDKLTLAALAAVLRLWSDPDSAAETIPALALLTRPAARIRAIVRAARDPVAEALGAAWQVECVDLQSQIGSGALPVDLLPSAGLAITPLQTSGQGRALERLQTALRGTSIPVIGRVQENRLLLDCRCLPDAELLAAQFRELQRS